MNIFETIEKTSKRIEPFHSQFLADALQASIGGDRSLFNAVWRLAAPGQWDLPESAEISAEEVVPGEGRIDIAIRCDSPERRMMGIEVKTTDSSVEFGQLERYRNGLISGNAGYAVAIAYLTPFNRKQAPDKANGLPTVKEFDDFQRKYPGARHISWLDIAAIPWNGNELWRQHQLYVYQRISSYEKLRRSTARDKSPDHGKNLAAFYDVLSDMGIDRRGMAEPPT